MPIRFPCRNPECGLELMISERSQAGRIRCPKCGTVQPVPRRTPRPAPPPEPPYQPPRARKPIVYEDAPPAERGLVADGLAAGWFAVKAVPRMLVLLLVFIGASTLRDLYVSFLSVFAVAFPLLGILALLLAGCFVYLALGLFLRFYLDVAVVSMEGFGKAPVLPRQRLGEMFDMGVKALGVGVVYVLPVVTLPLLPLGLLALACCDDPRGLDFRWAWRAARAHRRALGKLWLVMGVWLVLLAAGLAGLYATKEAWAISIITSSPQSLGAAIAASVVFVFGAVAMSLWACTLACAAFRCIGLLGRHVPEIPDSLPEDPDPPKVTAAVVAACAAVGVPLQYIIWWLAVPTILD
ncbi:MAG TPA: hypothetical protein VNA25_18755 [Phycisphaerae bacterium]|nr:hypothetical protein [Phycisphaerae bacterium]